MPRIEDLTTFVSADYSGIEVRILCQCSRDPLLTEQFNNGIDVHSQVGNKLTGWPVEKIRKDKETRRKIKEFHFGIAYGLGPVNGAKHMQAAGINMTEHEFRTYQERYFSNYQGVRRYIERCHKQAEELGYVETLFGFRRSIRKKDDSRGSHYLNQAINTPIQGSAHQLVLMAMALLRLKPKTYDLLQVPVMEVHDELCFFVRLGNITEADKQLRHLLEVGVREYAERNFGVKFIIPILAETSAGFTRATLVKYEESDIPPMDQFLEDWRKKYHEVAAKPVASIIPEIKIAQAA